MTEIKPAKMRVAFSRVTNYRDANRIHYTAKDRFLMQILEALGCDRHEWEYRRRDGAHVKGVTYDVFYNSFDRNQCDGVFELLILNAKKIERIIEQRLTIACCREIYNGFLDVIRVTGYRGWIYD